MPLNPLSTWNSTFNSQIVPTMGDFVTPFKSWLLSQAGLLTLAAMPSASFIFNDSAFGAAISAASPSMDKAASLQIFADGWASAVSASTMIVTGGSAAVLNVNSAKQVVYDTMFNADITQQSAFPEAMRSGLLALQYQVTIIFPPASYPSGTL